jgi:F-type H+-transporting ATPase subunit delta
MADNHTIARPYAQAAFEVARADNALTRWNDALEIAGELMTGGEIAEFLRNPSLSDARRLEFLTGLFEKAGATLFAGDDDRGSNFLKLLLEYGRVDVLPEIAERFNVLKDEVENTVEVTVTSAVPLSDERLAAIGRALETRFGRKVDLDTQLDEELIGGAVIRAGDVVIDGSLRARLKGLAGAMTK